MTFTRKMFVGRKRKKKPLKIGFTTMSFALNTKLVFVVPRQMFARFTMPIKIGPQEEKVIIYKDI